MNRKLTKLLAALFAVFLVSSAVGFAQVDLKKIKENLPKMLGANNAGTEFVMTFHPCWEENGPNNKIKIYVSSGVATQVNLYIPAIQGDQPLMSKKTVPNDVIEFNLDPNVAQCYCRGAGGSMKPLPSQVFKGKAIIIKAEAPIICYGVTRYQYTSDSYIAFPTNTLGKTYVIAAYTETCNEQAQYLNPYTSICGVYDNTRVTFTLGGNNNSFIENDDESKKIYPGQSVTKVINKGDVWLVAGLGPFNDITGSFVRATKPVSIMSGNHCVYIPQEAGACDFTIEQEMPIDAWGTRYHVTPIYGRKKSSPLRFFVKESNTMIYRDGSEIGMVSDPFGMENIGWMEKRANPDTNTTAVFSAEKPFYVVQYNAGQGDDGVSSDPFQLGLTPVEQYQKEIIFNTPGIRGGFGFTVNYVNLVYLATPEGQIPDDVEFGTVGAGSQIMWRKLSLVDGNPGTPFDEPANDQGRKYYSKTIKIPVDGVYKVRAADPFAAYAYGFSDYDSYGHPCSVALADLQKKDTIPPVPTYKMQCDGEIRSKDGLITDMPNEEDYRSNLSMIIFDRDNSYNYDFSYDDFMPGETRATNWSLKVKDPNQDALAVITFADRSGNDTTITVEYHAVKLSLSPKTYDFGTMKQGETKTMNFKVKNESSTSVAFLSDLKLLSTDNSVNSGFKLDFPWDIKDPLKPGESRDFTITFTAGGDGDYQDSIGVGDTCFFRWQSKVAGRVGSPIINVSDASFGSVTVNKQSSPKSVIIKNTGSTRLVITSFVGPTQAVYKTELPEITPEKPLYIAKGGEYNFSVTFTPDAVKDYPDSIVFISDADRKIDPVCVLSGNGIQPGLEATSDNWLNKRVDLPRYTQHDNYRYPSTNNSIILTNTGTQQVTINSINVKEDVNGDAFEVLDNGNYVPLKSVLTKYAVQIEKDGKYNIPVFFHPQKEGPHKLVLEYSSDAAACSSTLEGVGIFPKSSTQDYDFGTRVIGDQPSKKTIRYTNENWGPYADSLTITNLVVNPAGAIVATLGGDPGNEGFAYDATQIMKNGTETVIYPIVLQPGEYIDFPAEFHAKRNGNHAASLTTESDAEAEAVSNWKGFGINELLVIKEGKQPSICMNTTDEIVVNLENQGTSAVVIPADAFSLVNNTSTAFSIAKVVLTSDGSVIDITKDFSLEPKQNIDVHITYAPTDVSTNYPGAVHKAELNVKTNSITAEYQVMKKEVVGKSSHFSRVTNGAINNQKDVTVRPGQDVAHLDPITYTITVAAGEDMSLANVTEYTAKLTYKKDFLSIREENNKYLVAPGKDMPGDYKVTSVKLELDKATNVETATITMKGTTKIATKAEYQLLKVEFFAFLPWYEADNGKVVVKERKTTIAHVVDDNDQCVDYTIAQEPTANLTEVCENNLRPIAISSVKFGLAPVAPNPVSAKGGEISYSVGLKGMTEIKLFNSGSELVKTLVSEVKESGAYTVRIPIEDLPSGVYFYEMVSGPYRSMEKMVISK